MRRGPQRIPAPVFAVLAAAALSLSACGRTEPSPAASTGSRPAEDFSGTGSCAPCHEKETREWSASPHGRHGVPAKTPAPGFEAAVGSRFMQAYLRKDSSGLTRILPQCLDFRTGGFRHVPEVLAEIAGTWDEDSFSARGAPLEPVERRAFEGGCSGCHASQATLSLDEEHGRFDSRWVDLSINCETCHGAGAAHALAWKRGDASAPLVRWKSLTPRESVALCARCHGGVPSAFDYGPADAPHWLASLTDRRGLFPDGRASGQVYQAIQFVQSDCYRKGGLACTDCHAAHGPDVREGKDTDALCVRCHPGLATREHTHHEPSGAGARCIECHLPRLLSGLVAYQRDHTLGSPIPAVRSSPDACTACHKDQTKDWADKAYRLWWGDPPKGTVEAAEAIAAARRGRVDTAALARAQSHGNLWVRAAAAFHLGDWTKAAKDEAPEVRLASIPFLPRNPAGRDLLAGLLADPEPLIRSMALRETARRGGAIPPASGADPEIAERHSRHAADVRRARAEAAARAGRHAEGAALMVDAFLAAPLDADLAVRAAEACAATGRLSTARAILAAASRAQPPGEDRRRLESLFLSHGGTRSALADHP